MPARWWTMIRLTIRAALSARVSAGASCCDIIVASAASNTARRAARAGGTDCGKRATGGSRGSRRCCEPSLQLGLTSFGGPLAHLGYFERTYVRRLRWLRGEDSPLTAPT